MCLIGVSGAVAVTEVLAVVADVGLVGVTEVLAVVFVKCLKDVEALVKANAICGPISNVITTVVSTITTSAANPAILYFSKSFNLTNEYLYTFIVIITTLVRFRS